MHKFDRVFDGDDLATPFAVDEINKVIERRRLTGAGRSGDED